MLLPKVRIKKILYATDLSDSARNAFAYAVSLANRYDAGLTLLHVIDEAPALDRRVVGYISSDKWDEIKKRNEQDAREIIIGKTGGRVAIGEALNQFCQDVQTDMEDCTFRTDDILVVRGNPVEQILGVAKEKGCDLIVMGTHGHGGFAGAMIGSTARRVVRHSVLPVLVIRLADDD